MGYASRSGRAQTSSRNPRAFGICDRCGFLYNHDKLSWQFDWRGASLMNTRVLVCNSCLDVPQQQLRAIVVPADPVPIMNPRTQDYYAAETDIRQTSGQNTVDPTTGIPVPGGNTRITQDSNTRVTQETGEPPGGLNVFPGTLLDSPGNGNPNLPYGFTSIPEAGLLPGVNYAVWTNDSVNPLYWMPGPYTAWNPPTTVILNWVYPTSVPLYVYWDNNTGDNIIWTNSSSNDINWY